MQGFWTSLMPDDERPRLLAFAQAMVTILTLPVPIFAGFLYEIHPRLVPALVLVFLAVITGLLIWIRRLRANDPVRSAG
jgi:hypothetical protein